MAESQNQKNSLSLSKIPFFTSTEINCDESDKSSLFTLKSEHQLSVDLSEFPNLSDTKLVKSDSNQSSDKNNSPDIKSDNESQKIINKIGKSQEFEFITSSSESKSKNYEDEDTDNEENSDSTENFVNHEKNKHEKDFKAKGCCLCLIL